MDGMNRIIKWMTEGGHVPWWVINAATICAAPILASLLLFAFPSLPKVFESATSTSHALARNTAYYEFTERITVALEQDGLTNAQLLRAYDEEENFALKAFNRVAKIGIKENEAESINVLVENCKAKFEILKQGYVLSQRMKNEQRLRIIQSQEIKKLKKEEEASAARLWELEKAAKEKENEYPIIKIIIVAAVTCLALWLLIFCAMTISQSQRNETYERFYLEYHRQNQMIKSAAYPRKNYGW